MACNCKKTTKGIPNRSKERWLVQQVWTDYSKEIGDTTIQYFTSQQRQQVRYWYYQVYPNSVEVDYKHANRELIKVFEYHKLK